MPGAAAARSDRDRPHHLGPPNSRIGGLRVLPRLLGLRRSYERINLGGRERMGEQVALGEVTSEATQSLRLFGLFDAFGDGAEPEGVCEVDDELAERGLGWSGGEAVDEA